MCLFTWLNEMEKEIIELGEGNIIAEPAKALRKGLMAQNLSVEETDDLIYEIQEICFNNYSE